MKAISVDISNKQLANRPGKPEMGSSEVAARVVRQAGAAEEVRALLRTDLRSDT